MLFALGQPVAFAGLLLAFLLGIALRAVAIRSTTRMTGLARVRESLMPSPRADVDPYGAVVAALGGTGWGRPIDIDEVPRHRGRARAAAVFAAGPIVTILAGQLAMAGYFALFPQTGALAVYRPSDVLRGAPDETALAQFLLALAVGLTGFGLMAILPIPPLDGFGIAWSAARTPGAGLQWFRLWLGEKNIGIALLLLFSLFPRDSPFVLLLIDLIGTPLIRVWS